MRYTHSRYIAKRRHTCEVRVGEVRIGGCNPIVVQSMTTTPTQDVEATVKQSIALAEVGCQVVRITAQNVKAARALKDIRKQFTDAGFGAIPLVADIHFLPSAAMEAVEHVEKVRVNPGNYADKKKFAQREYTDSEYNEELERLHEAFSPLVLRAKELSRALRIGTNHGSLSDRIMNRYGDSPLGMVESALEFVRICELHGFRDIILSLKASNPKVMIEAYRLAALKMAEENMHYPLHLGVTEAGDGDDARIKSAIGIGSLLYDGLGDTIRVSLTEDPVYEIPVAQDLARKAEMLWALNAKHDVPAAHDSIDPFEFEKRAVAPLELSSKCSIAPLQPPSVIIGGGLKLSDSTEGILDKVRAAHNKLKDNRIEGLLVEADEWTEVSKLAEVLRCEVEFLVLDAPEHGLLAGIEEADFPEDLKVLIAASFGRTEQDLLKTFFEAAKDKGFIPVLDVDAETLASLATALPQEQPFIVCQSAPSQGRHGLGSYRALAEVLHANGTDCPIWIRNTAANSIAMREGFGDRLLEASMLTGPLICDGLGDLVSVETVDDLALATTLAYNLLQGARARVVKTEYVACPSCGRTLFDLQSTTQRIREATGHLKGVTIAVMGCIVNGPGEMADADFGYVGGAPGKINLYVGKECVQYHIPADEAVDRLIDLIREHGKWMEPVEESAGV